MSALAVLWQFISANISITLLTVILCLVVYIVLDLYLSEYWKFKHVPGPPRSCWIRGHLPEITQAMESDSMMIQDLLYDWAGKYGLTFKIYIFWKGVIMTADPAGVKEALLGGHPKANELYKGLVNLYGVRFLGKGLVTLADNELWDHRRKMMDPAFRRQFLKGQMDQFNESADGLIRKLQNYCTSGTDVSMVNEFHCVTLDLIGKVVFSLDINSVQDNNSPFPQAIRTILHAMYVQLFKGDFGLNPFKRKFYKTAREAVLFLRKVGSELIDTRHAALRNGEQVPEDILTHAIRVSEYDETFTKESLIDDFMTIFIAGHETTANTLSFILLELGQRPQVLEGLRSEICRVMGSSSHMTYEHVNNFTYMGYVIRESMRLYPTAPTTFRKTKNSCMVGPYAIPEDTILMVSNFVASRNPEVFHNPLDFIPERFNIKSQESKISIYSCFPFSLGPRSCIGQTFALIQTKVILAKFLLNFNFDLVKGQSFDMMEVSTLKPKGKVLVKLTSRSNE